MACGGGQSILMNWNRLLKKILWGGIEASVLSEKLGKAGDENFIRKLGKLTDKERKVLSDIIDTAGSFLKNEPVRAIKIFNEAGIEGVYLAKVMGKDSTLFFRGIENEGRAFISLLKKGNPDAVRFYFDELLPRKGGPGFNNELTKILREPQRYFDSMGKPTDALKVVLKRFKHGKLNIFLKSAGEASMAVVSALAGIITSILTFIPVLASFAAFATEITLVILGIVLAFLVWLIKKILSLIKPQKDKGDGKIFIIEDSNGKSIPVSIQKKVTTQNNTKQNIQASPANNWPVINTNKQSIIDIGIIGARAAGKSTFIIMLLDTLQKKNFARYFTSTRCRKP